MSHIKNVIFTGFTSLALSSTVTYANQSSELSDKIKKQTQENIIKIEGGSFKMGDFGKLIPETEGLYYSMNADNKPVHDVTVSSFRMQKYRVTNQDYDDYIKVTGREDKSYHHNPNEYRSPEQKVDPNTRWPDEAVTVDWYEAHDYCQWLGDQIGLQGSLPTEAQWEYAARSKGKLVILATDNGKAKEGINTPTIEQMRNMHPENFSNEAIRVGRFPPNPIGLYDMAYGGVEWMSDWYDANYYQHSPTKDPKGPESGQEKSQRGARIYSDGYAMTSAQLVFVRYHNEPDFYIVKRKKKLFMPGDGGMRCVFTPKAK